MSKDLSELGPVAHVAEVVHHGDKLTVPDGMAIDDAIILLKRRQEYLTKITSISRVFKASPFDGAYALNMVLASVYGWVEHCAAPGFFGESPPRMVDVEIGYNQKAQVPWGRFGLPNVDGYLETDGTIKNGMACFVLRAEVTRAHEATVVELFDRLDRYLKQNSIYRGQALRVRFCKDNGDALALPDIQFMDTESIDTNMLVFSDHLQSSINTNLFTPIRRVDDCLRNCIPIKRGVLLGGTYGTGKTLAAHVASKYAVDNGITYLYVPRAQELGRAVQFARHYQSPACVIFCEDIDRAITQDRTVEVDDILNVIDGIDSKNSHIITVLTTNNIEGINPAMLRPGRLDATINVTPPDAKAAERLVRQYGGDAIAADTDLTVVGEHFAGLIPAVVAEVVQRSKLAELSRTEPGELVSSLSSEALLESAISMKDQLLLLEPKTEETALTIDSLVSNAVTNSFNDTSELIKRIDDRVETIESMVS